MNEVKLGSPRVARDLGIPADRGSLRGQSTEISWLSVCCLSGFFFFFLFCPTCVQSLVETSFLFVVLRRFVLQDT